MSRLHAQIESLAQQFAQSVLSALREASLDDLLGEAKRGPGRPRGPGRSVSFPAAAPAARGGRGGKRVRRSGAQLESTLDKIVSLLKRNKDGLRSEQIQSELGITRKEIPRPIQLGLKNRSLRKKGQKRSTIYFAG